MQRFLFGSILALAVLASACGGDGNGSPTPSLDNPGVFPTSVDPSKPIPKTLEGKLKVVVAGGDFYVGDENNFVVGITDASGEPQGGAKVVVTFFDLSDPAKPKPVGTYQVVQSAPGIEAVKHTHASGDVHQHGGGDEDRVGYYVDNAKFDHPGFWGVFIEAELRDGTRGVSTAAFQVGEKPVFPAPGEKAIASDNLTKADVTNISEIDSGEVPNDMHEVKIKDAIAKGRPMVIVFATPAYCTSLFCGPVTEEVEAMHDVYKDQVDFIHIEIWRDFEKRTLNPTAIEWLQQPDGGLTEPWVYVVGKDGVIYDRWEGPVARNIIEPTIKAVAGGATHK